MTKPIEERILAQLEANEKTNQNLERAIRNMSGGTSTGGSKEKSAPSSSSSSLSQSLSNLQGKDLPLTSNLSEFI